MVRVHEAFRRLHHSRRTEESYVQWIRRFAFWSGKRHPETMGEEEVSAFLGHLANDLNVAAATQNQALAALRFLYRHVLGRDVPWFKDVVRAKRPVRLPVVLTHAGMDALLSQLTGATWLRAGLLYGCGLRLVYTHVLNRGGRGVNSPLDALGGARRTAPHAGEAIAHYRMSRTRRRFRHTARRGERRPVLSGTAIPAECWARWSCVQAPSSRVDIRVLVATARAAAMAAPVRVRIPAAGKQRHCPVSSGGDAAPGSSIGADYQARALRAERSAGDAQPVW